MTATERTDNAILGLSFKEIAFVRRFRILGNRGKKLLTLGGREFEILCDCVFKLGIHD